MHLRDFVSALLLAASITTLTISALAASQRIELQRELVLEHQNPCGNLQVLTVDKDDLDACRKCCSDEGLTGGAYSGVGADLASLAVCECELPQNK